ncbi:MAG TPA: YadA-like family protein [Luteimonas sp.]|nr:YadA-like family protein [Luteimonas sp.]
MSLPAAAGVTCQLFDPGGTDIGDGGADAGGDAGGNANATACGRGALATSAAATAFGRDAQATGISSMAVGIGTRASGSSAVALGAYANASGNWAIALGRDAVSNNWTTIGIGVDSRATGKFSAAIGAFTQAEGANSSAFGGFLGDENSAIQSGRFTRTTGARAVAFGAGAHAFADDGAAFGTASQVVAGATRSVALGAQSVASQADTVSLGHAAGDLDYMGNAFGSDLNRRLTHLADGVDDTDAVNLRQLNAAMADAVSPYVAVTAAASDVGTADAVAGHMGAIAIGSNAVSSQNYGIAIGGGSRTQGYSSAALGPAATTGAQAFGSVALGLNSVANEAYVVSFGHAAGDSIYLAGNNQTITFPTEQTRRLIHVAAGTGDTDAVNLSQLHPFATALGAGASYADGVFVAPGYVIQGNQYNDVGAAFAAVDARLTLIGGGSPKAIEYDDPGKTNATLEGAGGTTISNIAPGVAATDAVNKGQMDAGDAATLQSANEHTRAQSTATLQAANAYTDSRVTQMSTDVTALRADIDRLDRRFGEVDRRLDRLGAMSGAMSAAAMNTAGLAGDNRVGIGVGSQGGRAAMAVGYQRLVNARISVSLSAGFSGDDSSVSAGTGFSW